MRLLRGTQIIERRRGDCLQPRSRASLTSRAQVTPISDHPTTFTSYSYITSPGPGAARERAHRTASITSNHQVAQAAQPQRGYPLHMPIDVGVAYSGGGVTGALASLCVHQSLQSLRLPLDQVKFFSTASGGTLGLLVAQTTKRLTYPPPLSTKLTLEEMQASDAAPGSIWWANGARYIPTTKTMMAPSGAWWRDAMEGIFRLGYNVSASDVTAGGAHALLNFAVLRASGCPAQRNATSGVLPHAAKLLRHAILEALPSASSSSAGGDRGALPRVRVHVTGGPQLANASRVSLLDGLAFSTAFWAAELVESGLAYEAELAAEAKGLGLLMRARLLPSHAVDQEATEAAEVAAAEVEAAEATVEAEAEAEAYLMDGGLVDTTGIVALLQRGVQRVVAFYNNNDALAPFGSAPQSESASIAYLFGVPVPTDGLNSLAGPALLQVFPSHLYAAVIRNLTDGRGGMLAHLSRVPILRNDFLGIKGGDTLDELLLFSNGKPAAFLPSFEDGRIAKAVSTKWPDRMPLGMKPLEANLLCELQRWKLRTHEAAVRSLFNLT